MWACQQFRIRPTVTCQPVSSLISRTTHAAGYCPVSFRLPGTFASTRTTLRPVGVCGLPAGAGELREAGAGHRDARPGLGTEFFPDEAAMAQAKAV